MRCKNCGTENDDNRYICETCGSPLYSEDEIGNIQNEASPEPEIPAPAPPLSSRESSQPRQNEYAGNKKDADETKKNAIIIVILAVILVAVISAVAVVAFNNSNEEDETTSELTTASITEDDTTEERTYTSERTTEKTTESTTKQTTEKTTTAKKWFINTSSSGGGSVSGDGEYENGKRVTITAVPDDGYEFDGWYSSGIKVSDKETYTFKAIENASYSAVFNPVAEDTTAPEEDTTDADTEMMFGDND